MACFVFFQDLAGSLERARAKVKPPPKEKKAGDSSDDDDDDATAQELGLNAEVRLLATPSFTNGAIDYTRGTWPGCFLVECRAQVRPSILLEVASSPRATYATQSSPLL